MSKTHPGLGAQSSNVSSIRSSSQWQQLVQRCISRHFLRTGASQKVRTDKLQSGAWKAAAGEARLGRRGEQQYAGHRYRRRFA